MASTATTMITSSNGFTRQDNNNGQVQKQSSKPRMIGTHDGKFHTDEVFACYMLKKLPQYRDHTIVRTRNSDILAECEIVVDVGGVYSPERHRYDHHQATFSGTMRSVADLPFDTRLSSAGLIYAHFGRSVLEVILTDQTNSSAREGDAEVEIKTQSSLSSSTSFVNNFGMGCSSVLTIPSAIKLLYPRLYKLFVESVDAVDNGINQFACEHQPKYKLASTLDSRVGHCNPDWNDPKPDPDRCFTRAMQIIAEEFEDRVLYMYNSWLPARQFVLDAIQKRFEVHPSGRIIELSRPVPWTEHFFELEGELGLPGADQPDSICLSVFPSVDLSASSSIAASPTPINKPPLVDTSSSGATVKPLTATTKREDWRVQSVPVSDRSGFANRLSLPWRGTSGAETERKSGIVGAHFVHATGFIGGAWSREAALAMADKALTSTD